MYLFSLIYRQILLNIMYNIQVRSNKDLECNYVYMYSQFWRLNVKVFYLLL